MKFTPPIIFITGVFITLGLAISLQGVFGLNIAGVLTGPLNLGGNKITNVGAPTAVGDAATKGFVDTAVSPLPGSLHGSGRIYTTQASCSGCCSRCAGGAVVPASCALTCFGPGTGPGSCAVVSCAPGFTPLLIGEEPNASCGPNRNYVCVKN